MEVYRRAGSLADAIRLAVRGWSSLDQWTCGVQMIRAADSVGANVAEAYGRQSWADRLRLVYIARGSVCELQHWLLRATAGALVVPADAGKEAAEVGRLLNGLRRAWAQQS